MSEFEDRHFICRTTDAHCMLMFMICMTLLVKMERFYLKILMMGDWHKKEEKNNVFIFFLKV